MAYHLGVAFLLLPSLIQASPLHFPRQNSPPPSTTDELVVTAATGDSAVVTFTPSQVSDTALWTIQSPTTITPSDPSAPTETVYPSGYVWAIDAQSGIIPPAIPTDAPYPLPASLLSNGASSNSPPSATAAPPCGPFADPDNGVSELCQCTSGTLYTRVPLMTGSDICGYSSYPTDNPTGNPDTITATDTNTLPPGGGTNTDTGAPNPTTTDTDVDQTTNTDTGPSNPTDTNTGGSNPTTTNNGVPNPTFTDPGASNPTTTNTDVPNNTNTETDTNDPNFTNTGTGTLNATDTNTGASNPTDTDGGAQTTTGTGTGAVNPTDTGTGASNPTNTDTGASNPVNTNTGASNPTNTDTGTLNPTDTNTGGQNPTDTATDGTTTGTGTGNSDPANTNTGASNPANTDTGTLNPTNTATTGAGPTTNGPSNTNTAGPTTTTFPVVVPISSATDAFNNPSQSLTTLSVSGAPPFTYSKETFSDLSTITSQQTVSTTAVETDSDGHTSTFIGPIVVGPGGVFWGPPGLPPIPGPPGGGPPCIWPFCSGGGGSESSGGDDGGGGGGDPGGNPTDNPTDNPTNTDNQPTTTQKPTETSTGTESCSGSAVPQCTETISLSTSFFSDDPSSSTVKTVTSTACTTITTCDANPTTATTTVSTTASSGGIVCETNCASCMDKRDVYGEENIVRRDIGIRSLDNLDDWAGEIDSYVMEQVRSSGDNQELDWNFATQDAVSLSAEFKAAPLVRWITGIQGCTSITIVSQKGVWTSHFMEPGFMDRDQNDIQRWNDRIIAAMQNGASKFSKPSDLAGDGGILNPSNNVKILVSTPNDGAGGILYQAKVNTLLGYLTGNGAPWAGVTPDIRGYTKPTSESQAAQRKNTAYYKVMIEYDNNQLDDDGNQPSAGQEAIYRVWREQDHVDDTWTASDDQKGGNSCPAGNQKRDGTCSQPTTGTGPTTTGGSTNTGTNQQTTDTATGTGTITSPPSTTDPKPTQTVHCSHFADPDAGPGHDGCQCDGMTGLFPMLPSTSGQSNYDVCGYTTPPVASSTSVTPFTTTESDGLVISCSSSSYYNYAVNTDPTCAGPTSVVSTVSSIASAYASSTSAAAASSEAASSSSADASWSSAAATPSAGCWILDDDGFGDSLFQVYGINGWAGDEGDKLYDQEDGCGILSGWEFHTGAQDEFEGRERDTEWAVFGLSFFKGGCVERAVHSAGGPEPGDGPGQLACQHGPPDNLDELSLSAKSRAQTAQVKAVKAVANGNAPPSGATIGASAVKLAVAANSQNGDGAGTNGNKPNAEQISSAKVALAHMTATATGTNAATATATGT